MCSFGPSGFPYKTVHPQCCSKCGSLPGASLNYQIEIIREENMHLRRVFLGGKDSDFMVMVCVFYSV